VGIIGVQFPHGLVELRQLVRGQRAWLKVERTGPFVIEPERALRLAAERGAFLDRTGWRDAYDAQR
jgi:hypothetical protein